ncbi:Zinc finger CCCH domain-containing protein [Quillaja saponaria]|uniref:Zinc finger CCCH domain-containing protein n=1 Tax=Quillaja saponaria TaxID=32244 RepID=A0AAD7VGI1_QUISA|nr:Zinc finger CCCH domain-containing protein [Quillaja saponaria]
MFRGVNVGFYEIVDPAQDPVVIDDADFSSDEFRMYVYKIKLCPRTGSHDWTNCPFAHRGEKALRRDPRRIPYSAVTCTAFRNGRCQKGDLCEFAHGVFESWLHPSRYRTQACNAGDLCQRKVCFFAHTVEQLRPHLKIRWNLTYRARMAGPDNNVVGPRAMKAQMVPVPVPVPAPVPVPVPEQVMDKNEDINVGRVSEFLKTLRSLKLSDDYEVEKRSNWNVSDSDLPHIGWISDLVD